MLKVAHTLKSNPEEFVIALHSAFVLTAVVRQIAVCDLKTSSLNYVLAKVGYPEEFSIFQ